MILYNKYKTSEYEEFLKEYNDLVDKFTSITGINITDRSIWFSDSESPNFYRHCIHYYIHKNFYIQHIIIDRYYSPQHVNTDFTLINIFPNSINTFVRLIYDNKFGYIMKNNNKIQFHIHTKQTLLKHLFRYHSIHDKKNSLDINIQIFDLLYHNDIKIYTDYAIKNIMYNLQSYYYQHHKNFDYLKKVLYSNPKYINYIIKYYNNLTDITKCRIYFNLIKKYRRSIDIYPNVLKIFCKYLIMTYKRNVSHLIYIVNIMKYIKTNKILNIYSDKFNKISRYLNTEYDKINEYTTNIIPHIDVFISISKSLTHHNTYSHIDIKCTKPIFIDLTTKIHTAYKKNKTVPKSELCTEAYTYMEKVYKLIPADMFVKNTTLWYHTSIFKHRINKVKKILLIMINNIEN